MDPATAQAVKSGASAGVGTASGAASGYLDNKYNKKALTEFIRQQGGLQNDITQMGGVREGQTTQAYAPFTAGMADTTQDYFGALKGTDLTKFDVNAPGAYQGKSVNELTQEMMNPQIDVMRKQAQGAVEGSAANAGKLFSGVTAGNIAERIAGVEADQYDKARTAAQQQDVVNRNDFQSQYNNLLKQQEFNKGNVTGNLDNMGTLYGAQTGAFGKQQEELTAIRAAQDQALLQSKAEEAAAKAQKAGTKSGFAAAVSGGLQGMANALK